MEGHVARPRPVYTELVRGRNMNCRTVTIFGARFAPQRLRPFRDRSLGVSPQIQRGWRTAALVRISGLEFGHRNMSVREVPIGTLQIFYALAFMKGRGSKTRRRKRPPTEAASSLFPWRHLDRDMRRGANHLNASIRNKAPECFQHQEEFLRKHGGTSSG